MKQNYTPLGAFKIYFFIVTVVTVAAVFVFNYFIDPLQFYNKSDKPIFVENQRYQVAGLIKNYEFDTVFVGTSLSENFNIDSWEENTGEKALNLSISGSSINEQISVVKKVLESGKVSKIIWEMNYRSFGGEQPNLITNAQFPRFLYDESWKTPLMYLFSFDTLWMSVKNIMGKGHKDLATLNVWWDDQKHKFDGVYVSKHFCSQKKRSSPAWTKKEYFAIIEQINEEIIKLNPEVEFKLFIPPMSFLNFAISREKTSFENFRPLILDYFTSVGSAQLFDFVAETKWITALTKYKDIEHFDIEISNRMLSIMSQTSSPSIAVGSKNTSIDSVIREYSQLIPSCEVSN